MTEDVLLRGLQIFVKSFAAALWNAGLSVCRSLISFFSPGMALFALLLAFELGFAFYLRHIEDVEAEEKRIFMLRFMADFDESYRMYELAQSGMDWEEYEESFAYNMEQADRDFLSDDEELREWMEEFEGGRYMHSDFDAPPENPDFWDSWDDEEEEE